MNPRALSNPLSVSPASLPAGAAPPPVAPAVRSRGVMRRAILVCLAVAVACSQSYRVGDDVMVEWEGKEYPAVILSADGASKFKVHYDGFDEAWDEVVPKSRVKGLRTFEEPRPEPPSKVKQKAIEAAETNTYHVGDNVRVEWRGKFYPAQIMDIVGKERYLVHYEGYGHEFDENVGIARVQAK